MLLLGDVSDKAKHSLFLPPVGLITTKFQPLKIYDFGSHDPSRSHDLGNVNWPLSRKPLAIEPNRANFRTPWV